MDGQSGIRVKGLDKHLTTDKDLKMYFRNPKNGGGDIRKIYYPLLDNDAVILFKNDDIVHNILSIPKHLLHGTSIKLSRLPPMVFTTIEAKLEPDISSIVLGTTDIYDELKFYADVEICSHEEDNSCSLKGDWYQIERAWQIIHLAMGYQKKIQYRLQQQLSTENGDDKSRARYRPQGKSTDLEDDSDDSDEGTPRNGSSVPHPYSAGRKMQDSQYSVVGASVTDSIISSTPFEDDIAEEVRGMGQKKSAAATKSSSAANTPYVQGDSEEMYTSHKYNQRKVGDKRGKSFKSKTNEESHSSYSSKSDKGHHSGQRSEGDKGGYSSYRSEADRGTGHTSHSAHRHLASPSDDYSRNYSSLQGTTYDHLFPRVEIVSPSHQTDTRATGEEVGGRGSKTYTVPRHQSRSLLDDVQMNSDDSETEVMSISYQKHRQQDQNDTFKHFSSQISVTEHSDSVAKSSSRRGSNDSDTRLRQAHNYNTVNGTGSHARDTNDMLNSARSQGTVDVDNRFSSLPVMSSQHDVYNGATPGHSSSRLSESDEYKKSYGEGFTASSTDLDLEKAISASLKSSGPVEDYSVVDSYEFYVGYIKVVIFRGNITEVKTSGIVNAANGYLAHGAGIAGAIAMAAGPSMQQECEELKRKYGALETTTVVHTQAGGRLNREVNYILHAVGPIWIEAIKGRCTFELILTYLNCFRYAEKIWLDSVSLPCISAGIFGCPLDVSIQSFLDGLLIFHSESGESCHLREVHLVNNDLDGVVTSIVLIKSLLDNGLDSAIAQSLDRYGTLSKTHGGAIRNTKTLRPSSRQLSKDDDIIGARSSSDAKRLPARRSSSLQRTDRKSSGFSSSGSTSGRSVIGASNSSAFKSIASDRVTEPSSRQSLRDKTSVRGRSEERPLSSRSREPVTSSGKYESPRSGSSVSSRSKALGSDSSEIRPRSSSGSKKKVSEQILASQGSSAALSSPRGMGSSRAPPQMKQALVGTSNGARLKQTSLRTGKATPVKATTLRQDSSTKFRESERGTGSRVYKAGTREYNRGAYLDGSQSLPMGIDSPHYSSSRLRGNSPRRYTDHKY
ncbi:uncharacterized protein LOC110455922 [Mizuhopecten yessoensis]|uniref:Macro domain-containing protein n=1 Tax=Mizuhopecten yessoensis TaxID=6573 RepID=A0A210QC35_MIZYE|nr:uncharacterized protein LOC110455922 [Mizuhopecten yessoensis]OWF46306.1 hypothetical protein KP79_PYT16992 [Mizuhopecten yessoensis]